MERADAKKEHVGLVIWENAPDGNLFRSDFDNLSSGLLSFNDNNKPDIT